MKFIKTVLLCLCFTTSLFAKKYEVVEIKTQFGNIYVWLYKDTPLHRNNFIKLAKKGFFDHTTFHRVIKTFMIQGGDPYSHIPEKKDSIGEGGPGYELKAEIKHTHQRGVIAAARNGDEVNPEQKSSGSQFYIVQGTKYTDMMLDQAEGRINGWWKSNIFYRILYRPANKIYQEKYLKFLLANKKDSLLPIQQKFQAEVDSIWKTRTPFKFTPEQREMYKTTGGAAHLDGNYTAFGEVLSGMEVVDKIADVKTGAMARPLQDVKMEVKVLKMSKKQFQEKFKTDPPKS